MSGSINPYQRWLGLNVATRPDCYTLLGVAPFEQDVHRIRAAAESAIQRASFPGTPEEEPARQTLVREIQSASICLTDPSQKAAYDQQLRAYYSQAGGASPQSYASSTSSPVPGPAVPPGSPGGPTSYGGMGSGAGGAYPQPGSGLASTGGGVATAESTAAASATASGGPQLKVPKRSRAKGRRRKSVVSKIVPWVLVLLIVGGAGGGYYYLFMAEYDVPPPEVAQDDSQDNPTPKPTPPPVEEEDRPDRERPQPGGNRPSANDLAGSIGGLGDPDEVMEGMEQGDDTSPSEPIPPVDPTPEEIAQLTTAIQEAWQAIGNRQWAAAQTVLDEVRLIAKTVEGEQQYARTHRLARDLNAFYQAVEKGLEQLESGAALQVGSTEFTVSANHSDRLILRVGGQSKTYSKDSIPEGLARAIALATLEEDDRQKQRIEASVLALSDLAAQAYRKERWEEAGGDPEVLAKLEADKANYLADFTPEMAAASMENDSPEASSAENGDTDRQEAREWAAELAVKLTRARQLLGERKLGQAKQQLEGAEQLVTLESHGEKLARVHQLVGHVETFWAAVQDELGTLQADTELEVGSTITSIVEVSREHLILRVSGQNRRYTLDDMPAGLARHLAEQQLGPNRPETLVIVGSFTLIEPEGGPDVAREKWERAKAAGGDVDDLWPALEDTYDLEDDFIEQVAVIPESELGPAAQEFQQAWGEKTKGALRPADRQSLAREMLTHAISAQDGSPDQFVAFRYALAEAAKGLDFDVAATIIKAWEKRFAIDAWDWHYKTAQLAAGSSTSPSVQKTVAEHIVKMVPQLREAGRTELAQKLWSLGDLTAKRARERSLVDALSKMPEAQQ